MNRDERILRGAVQTIKEFGWKQGSMGTDQLGYCAVGAISRAARVECHGNGGYAGPGCEIGITVNRPLELLRKVAVERTGRIDISTVLYNDDSRRTRDEVLSALEEAAEMAG